MVGGHYDSDKWNQRLEELRQFKMKNGGSIRGVNRKLYIWLVTQRSYYKIVHSGGKVNNRKLWEERFALLKEVDPYWNNRRAGLFEERKDEWIEIFQRLSCHKRENGTILEGLPEDLARKINRARQYEKYLRQGVQNSISKEKMSEETRLAWSGHFKELDKIDKYWCIPDNLHKYRFNQNFDLMLEALQKFSCNYGHVRVTRSLAKDGLELGKFVSNVRALNKDGSKWLTQEHRVALDKLNFRWEPSKDDQVPTEASFEMFLKAFCNPKKQGTETAATEMAATKRTRTLRGAGLRGLSFLLTQEWEPVLRKVFAMLDDVGAPSSAYNSVWTKAFESFYDLEEFSEFIKPKDPGTKYLKFKERFVKLWKEMVDNDKYKDHPLRSQAARQLAEYQKASERKVPIRGLAPRNGLSFLLTEEWEPVLQKVLDILDTVGAPFSTRSHSKKQSTPWTKAFESFYVLEEFSELFKPNGFSRYYDFKEKIVKLWKEMVDNDEHKNHPLRSQAERQLAEYQNASGTGSKRKAPPVPPKQNKGPPVKKLKKDVKEQSTVPLIVQV